MPTWLHKRTSQLFALMAALTFVTPAIGKDTLALEFGVISTESSTSVVRKYMPTLKMLEQSMTAILDQTVDIRMKIVSEQKQGIHQLTQGYLDFASLNNGAYLISKLSTPDLRILAAQNAMDSNTLTPWVARSGLPDSIFMALRESLFNIRNSKVLTSLRAFEFVQGHDSQYADDTGDQRNSENRHRPATMTMRSGTPSEIPGLRTSISVLEPLLLSARDVAIQIDKYVTKAEFHDVNLVLER
jgi:ABC-type phosphate/phosphonate transport system substrate-binding protein